MHFHLPDNFGFALLMTLLAGLATAIGGAVAFVVKPDNLKALSVGLGFSAGVMIFLSFMDIIPESQKMLQSHFPNDYQWIVLAGFVIGILVAMAIDYFVPDHIDQEELFHCDEPMCVKVNPNIKRAGLFTAVAICVHNFPEGMATFLASTQDIALGISVAIAIAIHNIPEGIAVALPIYQATGKKRFAMLYASLSGLSEPVGAFIGIFLFQLFLPNVLVGLLFAAVAGIMIYISFDTLLPLAKEYGDWHLSLSGIMSGMLFMWITVILLH